MYYKKFIGDKVYLSPIDVNDYQIYTQYVNDLDVTLGLGLADQNISEPIEKEILSNLSKDNTYAIIDIETDTLIGNCGMMDLDLINGSAVVGLFIGNKDYWSNGYGRNALELLVDYGFNILNIYNIRLSVHEYNRQAIRCYEKIGFKEAGRIRGARMVCGTRYDLIYMDLLREEFNSVYVKSVLDRKLNNPSKI